MIKSIFRNKLVFYALICLWFIAGSVIFNTSLANAQTQHNQQELFTYINLFVQAFHQIRMNYVEELSNRDLIENAIVGMYDYLVEQDSTYISNERFRVNFEHISNQGFNPQQEMQSYLRLFQDELLMLLADTSHEATLQDLVTSAIDGMFSDLDPNSGFLRREAFRRLTDLTQGGFGGLGISIDRQGDYVVVVSPIEGTPAYKMGIQSADKIVEVDGVNVVGMQTDDVISRMRGEPGTRVVIGIERPGLEGLLEFDIIREIIRLTSVPYAFVLDNGIGYIRIREFNANTTNELREALDDLEAEGIEGLIIDLRSNTGGLLNEAVDTVNEFIGQNKLVVFTRGRARGTNREYNTMHNRMRANYPVVTMINQASASASEIFAGSLQDWDRGVVVGMPSFGKGSVQSVIPLGDNYGMRVTISKYYIKSGRSIHKDLNDRLMRGEDISQEEIEAIERANESNIYYTVNGRQVIGGGGIIPDIEIEGTLMSRLERDIRRLNLFFEYSMEYFTNHRDEIEIDFRPDSDMIADFLAFGETKGLEFTDAEADSSMAFIEVSLTRDIISRKFGDTEGYKVAIPIDTQLTTAMQLFDRYRTMEEMLEYAINY
ncbi:MAG: S41 family peptidase [Candidatus Cloacimonetes bacterium]|nr:S41 family peptidase [Candidatus Cloacimonadota bacterium]